MDYKDLTENENIETKVLEDSLEEIAKETIEDEELKHEKNNSGLIIYSFIVGLISLVLYCNLGPFAIALGISGLVTAIIGLKRNGKTKLGVAALVLNIVVLTLGVIISILGTSMMFAIKGQLNNAIF